MRETLRVSIPNPQSSRSFFYSYILNVAFCTGHYPGFNRRGIPKEAGQEAADQREQTACQKNCPSLSLWTQHIVPLKKPLSLYVVSIRLFLTSCQFFMPPKIVSLIYSKEGSSKVRDQLVEVLGNRLLSVVASQLPGSPEKLLRELFQCCRRNNPSIRVQFGTFFDNLVEALKKGAADGGHQSETSNAAVPKKTSTLTTFDQKRITLNEFIQEKLGVLHVRDLFPSEMKTISPEQLDKLAFLLNNVKTVEDLDDVRSLVTTLLSEKKEIEEKEPFKQVLLLVEKTFDQVYWSQECIKIQTMLADVNAKSLRQSTNAQMSKEAAMEREFFLNSVERLKMALTWAYCRKSYQEKLEICSELRHRFRSTAWRDFVKKMLKKKDKRKKENKKLKKKKL
ncbi:hypothetical protein DAPPUDRAFT_119928 [Daphnia pulex]|uniref:Uncharacterized protein n=1 Tax=Daphnia pulex TaxID=6669 RepID=E9HZV7_DAPPU|nr:hypothetical protein DAPPUDRAFT_119928 [Daphnia pulex]|eukprot:EFX62723.1 hypothetical protein DAPPUDRAFT_119928 [Daphnia pulex]